jgi:hypothetical protein
VSDPSAELPELGEMIPVLPGEVYDWEGYCWVSTDQVRNARHQGEITVGTKGSIVRVGFKLYEIIGYESSVQAYRLRHFKATLNRTELMKLSGQALRGQP